MTPSAVPRVTVRAPGKVNLALHVGGLDRRGFHPLATVFHAVSLSETVVATRAKGLSLTVSGESAAAVPTDATNLAHRAATFLASRHGVQPDVDLHLIKHVPVAGGMAGGSADAAATLLACNELWGLGLSRPELIDVARHLGSDVGFPLVGGTALGQGYGNDLTSLEASGTYHWVFALQSEGLSTPSVFAEFDRLNTQRHMPEPRVSTNLRMALQAGDRVAVGAALHNDLQPAALSLRPELGEIIAIALAAGALGSIVSGSGPTVAALANDAASAGAISAAWREHPAVASVRLASGAAPAAQVLNNA